MKIMKSYRRLIPIFGIPAMLITFATLWFLNANAAQLFKIHWLALLCALIFVVVPGGKKRFAPEDSEEKPRNPPWLWLLKIFFLQLCLTAIFFGVSVAIGQTVPALTSPHPDIFYDTMKTLLIYEGLFPWAFFVLLAAGFGYYSYCRQEDAYLATPLRFFSHHEGVIISVNFIGRFLSLFALAVTLGGIALLWASATASAPMVTGFFWTPALVSLILLLLSFSKIIRRNLKKSLRTSTPTSLLVWSWTIFLAVALWLLNGFLAPLTNNPLSPPTLLNHWLQQPWENLWLIFINSAWLLWAPLMGITLARISRGYRIRDMILASLVLPLICSVALTVTHNAAWILPPIFAVLITSIALLGLLTFIFHQKALPSFVLIYLPALDRYKFRSAHSILIKVMQTAAGFLFIYLPYGVIGLNFFLFFLAWPALIIFAGVISAIMLQFFRSNTIANVQ